MSNQQTWEEPLQIGDSLTCSSVTLTLLAVSLGISQRDFTITHLLLQIVSLSPAGKHKLQPCHGYTVCHNSDAVCANSSRMQGRYIVFASGCVTEKPKSQGRCSMQTSAAVCGGSSSSSSGACRKGRAAYPALRLASATAPRSCFFSRRSLLPVLMLMTSSSWCLWARSLSCSVHPHHRGISRATDISCDLGGKWIVYY